MKNESCLQLLKKLQMLSIDIGSKTILMNTLLNLSQEFVNKMLKFEDRSQFEVLFYVLLNVEWIQCVLCNDCAIQHGIAIEGAKLIVGSKSSFHVNTIGATLCNQNIIEAGIAIEGAKLLLQTKNDIQAECAYHVLCNQNTIETGIAIEGIELILQTQDFCKALSICKLLCSANAENATRILNGAKLLLQAKNGEQEQHIIRKIFTQIKRSKQKEITEIYERDISMLISYIEEYQMYSDEQNIDYDSYQKYLQKS